MGMFPIRSIGRSVATSSAILFMAYLNVVIFQHPKGKTNKAAM